jgi:hypothetical protein
MSITRCEEDHAPPYQPHDDEGGLEYLKGTLRAKRYTEVLHNINPTGGVTDLDMRAEGFVDGLGVWELKVVTDCVSGLGTPCLMDPKLLDIPLFSFPYHL